MNLIANLTLLIYAGCARGALPRHAAGGKAPWRLAPACVRRIVVFFISFSSCANPRKRQNPRNIYNSVV